MEGVTILLIELNPPSPPGGYLVKPLFYHKGTQHMNWKITLGNNKGGNQLGLTRYLKYPNCISQTIPITYKKNKIVYIGSPFKQRNHPLIWVHETIQNG